jgi:hypothetical protein
MSDPQNTTNATGEVKETPLTRPLVADRFMVGAPNNRRDTFEYRRTAYLSGPGSKEHISGETE